MCSRSLLQQSRNTVKTRKGTELLFSHWKKGTFGVMILSSDGFRQKEIRAILIREEKLKM
jgi:hypothetical protein